MMCSFCQVLRVGTSRARPHPQLQLQQVLPYSGSERCEEQFICKQCRTIWLRPKDKWGADMGFRLSA